MPRRSAVIATVLGCAIAIGGGVAAASALAPRDGTERLDLAPLSVTSVPTSAASPSPTTPPVAPPTPTGPEVVAPSTPHDLGDDHGGGSGDDGSGHDGGDDHGGDSGADSGGDSDHSGKG